MPNGPFPKLLSAPRLLFLIDGGGALLSAFLLGVVLVRWESVFGIPARVLYVLAAFPVLFAVYDGYAYRRAGNRPAPYLRRIAGANWGYCLVSIGLAWFHRSTITGLGWAYLLGEIAIVIALAGLEWRVAAHLADGS